MAKVDEELPDEPDGARGVANSLRKSSLVRRDEGVAATESPPVGIVLQNIIERSLIAEIKYFNINL